MEPGLGVCDRIEIVARALVGRSSCQSSTTTRVC